ncbi:formate/nitrite transporter family protein [Streptococcus pseudoporcinus]|uniref:Formate/nitrite transporter n=2 Tax=Streptococcus pseudoporcinus TaxID=361101 RepID=G5K8Y6_9STRE|nr:formate/nitrite transporter family protein [Streptococcus pseudoporcinus]EFR44027.1 formate/nitrite transporter [Streptococcus pseudoporcinus SPIN 20026]EHI64321.1 formate/nitrite transporter [Streptococcus pseudoporcinus LQ 940-04]VEF93389.1 formate/nitrite transporter family protein [Streptococcus pseudoporcinus]VTS12777.1 formate/nitrite transporter family protein [Streptococcus pseudoporcinus]VUC65597.1 formate/nitrite transporter family protein [Streptococcus pseudoporcinus]
MKNPEEIIQATIAIGQRKVEKPFLAKAILGFIGGAMISLGYLLYVRIAASGLETFGAFSSILGACAFPIGLIIILMAGGELITGNMMAVSASFFAKKIPLTKLLKNWLVITLFNVIGAIFVAYVFGHFLGLTSSGVFKEEVIHVAQAKIVASPLQAFVSGIGCNWFVGLALWLNYGASDASGKLLGIWFPVMTFVALGFQHSVANAFIIPAAIFENGATWLAFVQNFALVYAGNIVGGAVFVSLFYYKAFYHD